MLNKVAPFLAASILCLSGAVAKPIHGGAAIPVVFGCGSTGFLSTCSSTFNTTNRLEYSEALATSPWARFGNGSAAPTVTNNVAVTPPSGASAVSSIVLPQVSASGNWSYICQSLAGAPTGWPTVDDVYLKGAAGGEKLYIFTTTDGVHYKEQVANLTTAWQRVALSYNHFNYAPEMCLGVDLRDSAQSGTSGTETIYATGAQGVAPSFGQEWAYIPTTSAIASANSVLTLPSGVAFRNFSSLVAYGSCIQSPCQTSTLFGNVGNSVAGTNYGFGQAPGLNSFLEYSTAGNLYSWTYGSTMISNSASGWDSSYLVHGAMSASSPGCGSGTYAYCFYYAGKNPSGNEGIGIATSPDSVNWTKLSQINFTDPAATYSNFGLPAVLDVGATRYIYTANNNSGGSCINIWDVPQADGGVTATPLYDGCIQVSSSGNWTSGSFISVIDPFAWKNSHGFYELVYTATVASGGGSAQLIGYAVAASPTGPWYPYDPAATITETFPLVITPCGTCFPGDGATVEQGGTFYFFYDGAQILPVATMTDY